MQPLWENVFILLSQGRGRVFHIYEQGYESKWSSSAQSQQKSAWE